MSADLDADVIGLITTASRSAQAMDDGLRELRNVVALRNWEAVEGIRAKLLASVDSYVDAYAAAGRRLEQGVCGGG